MEALDQLHEEMGTTLAELFRLKLLPDESTNAMNREPQEEEWEFFEDDSLREETQQLVSEESQEDVNESQSLETPIVVPPRLRKITSMKTQCGRQLLHHLERRSCMPTKRICRHRVKLRK